MNLNNSEHIDLELLKNYYEGKLSIKEKNALEKSALTDPFLADAMDGFEENPGSFYRFYDKNNPNKGQTSKTLFMGIGVLVLLMVSTLIINNTTDLGSVTPDLASNDSIVVYPTVIKHQKEVEKLSPSIKAMQPAPEQQQIRKKELVTNTKAKVDQAKEKAEAKNIKVDDVIPIDKTGKAVPEPIYKESKWQTPTIYLYDLLVVDYRQIKRTKNNILYTRFELGGTSADRENNDIEDAANLIETKVDLPYIEYLEKTMYYFSKNTYKKSLNRCLTILEQYPKDLNALFYGGLSYYNLKKYEEASTYFNQVIGSDWDAFQEESQWYQAKTFVQLNEIEPALELLDRIILEGGFYKNDAIQLKRTLS
ncbi:tetratricopeptide repeat protein [Crocinitomix catalasitica]|uniref:tetratricopeptide repeat protein n=1 Tax=Crocinitomix catalasitica TaxID=184607 RepID=UPI000481F6CA|nr:tetratricopeptide repeat protein [Crocinitomix catalasitica]